MKNKSIKIFSSILTSIDIWFLTSITFLFSLLRIPSLIEPDWYGDEGIYQVIGMAMRSGRVLYKEIWDNKPPMLYSLYAIVNGDLFGIKMLSLIFGVAAVISFFLLAKKLLKTRLSVYLSTSVFAIVFGLPIIEGNIANAENFMLFPTILAFYFLLLSRGNKKMIYSIISGLLLSFAFLIKIVAVFDFVSILLIIFLSKFYDDSIFSFKSWNRKHTLKILQFIKDETIFIASFLLPIALASFYFLINGAMADFYRAAFSQNIGYVGYGNYFLFPMGLLVLKVILLLFSIFLILNYRKIIGFNVSFILIWLSFSLFNAMFSARPYTHYLLVALPALALFLGIFLSDKRVLKITLPIGVIIYFLITLNFGFYTKIIPYYNNYFNFTFGEKSTRNYESFFDRNTPRDYDLARFIKSKTLDDQDIFIWGDSGQIYALADKLPPGRYIVAYHITFYEDAINETKNAIDLKKPRFIIQTKESSELLKLLDQYSLKYKINNTKIYERKP